MLNVEFVSLHQFKYLIFSRSRPVLEVTVSIDEIPDISMNTERSAVLLYCIHIP